MNYGAVIKRAWQITWRYKALWLLGLFAGVSGCQGGGSPGGQGDTGRDMTSEEISRWTGMSSAEILSDFRRLIPLALAFGALLLGLWLAWMVLGVAARGGLITSVNDIEEGRVSDLASSWRAGFSRFWALLGLGILLQLPLLVAVVLLVGGVLLPFAPAIMNGTDPGMGVVAPICGVLLVGVPVLIAAGLVLDIMYLIGQRYLMLGNQRVFESARNAWRFFRVRAKDSFVMYLIGGVLNALGGLAAAIPAVILLIPIVIGGIAAGTSETWSALAGLVALGIAVIALVAWLYTAVFGTFSSALWTLFFREELGMSPVMAAPAEPFVAPEPVVPYTEVPNNDG